MECCRIHQTGVCFSMQHQGLQLAIPTLRFYFIRHLRVQTTAKLRGNASLPRQCECQRNIMRTATTLEPQLNLFNFIFHIRHRSGIGT